MTCKNTSNVWHGNLLRMAICRIGCPQSCFFGQKTLWLISGFHNMFPSIPIGDTFSKDCVILIYGMVCFIYWKPCIFYFNSFYKDVKLPEFLNFNNKIKCNCQTTLDQSTSYIWMHKKVSLYNYIWVIGSWFQTLECYSVVKLHWLVLISVGYHLKLYVSITLYWDYHF